MVMGMIAAPWMRASPEALDTLDQVVTCRAVCTVPILLQKSPRREARYALAPNSSLNLEGDYGPRIAPVHWAAGSDGDTNFGVTLLAAPNAASSRVARYSFTARRAACTPSSLLHSDPEIDRCLLASATIRLESTAKPSPPTRPTLMHAFTTRSNTLPKMSLSRNRSLRARENAE